jgi:hypothetical protein
MFDENAIKIELHRRGKLETIEIQQSRVLVGSGAHCDLRLSPEEAAIEQLLIEGRDDAIHVRVTAFDPPCRLNGAPFLEGRLSADAMLELSAGTALRISAIALVASTKQAKKNGAETPPAVQAIGLLAVAAGLYFMLDTPAIGPSVLESSATPPELAQQHEEPCPQSEAGAAGLLAQRLVAEADSKRERSPFYASDGLIAVRGYLRAAACFSQAGDPHAAEDARKASQQLRTRLSDELHARHVRLERLLAEQKYADIRHEVRLVHELVEDRSHPYASWLSQVEREAEIRTSTQKRK